MSYSKKGLFKKGTIQKRNYPKKELFKTWSVKDIALPRNRKVPYNPM
jgi:hypothetical protein